MKFQRLFYIGAMLLALASCKKDEDSTVLPSLNGRLRILSLPEFIEPGQTLTLKPSGVTHPDGKEVGYYWKVTPTMTKYDTTRYTNGLDKPDASGQPSDGAFTHKFSDTLKTYTVYCYAFASGYSGLSASSYTTVVEGGKDKSIKGITFPSESVETEDGTYYYGQIGTQTWTFNNLCEKGTDEDLGLPFRNAEVMSDVFGRYYNYADAAAACAALPGDEWKLPTEEDWNILENYIKKSTASDSGYGHSVAAALMGNATFNENQMWGYWPNVGDITNSTGFSAISAGYANTDSGNFTGAYEYAMFWTATENPDNASQAYCKYIICDQPEIFTRTSDKDSFGASVRCIKKIAIADL